MPIFWKLKRKYPTAEKLAEAEESVVLEMVKTLGLQNARSKRLISMAKAWVRSPPSKGWMYRTLNYPEQGDGRAREVQDVVEEDIPIVKGSLEIGNMVGCGSYAFDSWRIFCRDLLRGVADDYDGKNADTVVLDGGDGEDGKEEKVEFEPEWKRVLPQDKELRACLRWMWMREGVVWDPITGRKMGASEVEMEMAREGTMMVGNVEGEVKGEEGRASSSPVKGEAVSSPVKGEDGGDVPL